MIVRFRDRARAGWPEPGQRHGRARVPEHVGPHGAVYRFGLKTRRTALKYLYSRDNQGGPDELKIVILNSNPILLLTFYHLKSANLKKYTFDIFIFFSTHILAN